MAENEPHTKVGSTIPSKDGREGHDSSKDGWQILGTWSPEGETMDERSGTDGVEGIKVDGSAGG